MQKIWYKLIQLWIRINLYFYYQKIQVVGAKNIPKKGAILFIANHQNALLDALLIPTTNNRNTYFLTRASAFKKRIITWLLGTINMIPIYRIRDGIDSIAKNEAIFNKCFDILHKQEALLIFPEGNHNIARKVRPLKKGFVRILFGALEKYPDLQIQIVPIGLNYDYAMLYPSNATIQYGKPILANTFYDSKNIANATKKLQKNCHDALCKLTTHIEDTKNYDAILATLKNKGETFLVPKKTNVIIQNLENLRLIISEVLPPKKNILYPLLVLNTFIPWLVWKRLESTVKEPEFISTARFVIGISLAPIFWVLQASIISYFFENIFFWMYLIASFLLVLMYTKIGLVKAP